MNPTHLTSPEVRAELAELIHEMLDGISEASIPAGLPNQPAGHDGVTIESYVPILSEDERAILTVRVPAPTALALAGGLIGEHPGELGIDDARETLAELTNVLAGSAKSLFDAETALDVPTSAAGPTGTFPDLSGSVMIEHFLGTFEVHLAT